jgi:hypothetical protein
LELGLRDASLRFSQRVLGGVMSGLLQQVLGVDTPPGRRGCRTTTVFTAVGNVSYSRAHVRRQDGGSSFPADEALGLVEKCTPMGARLLCHEAASSQSYQQAAGNIAMSLGIDVSASTIQRLVEVVGPDVENWALNREPAKAANLRDCIVVVQVDMTGVRMLKEYLAQSKGVDGDPTCRQIKCGKVFLMQKDSDGVYQKMSESAVHALSFSDPATFSADLMKARLKLGVPWDTQMLMIGDGAEWIWNIAKDRFNTAVQILDFWHAADNLNKLCVAVYGKEQEAKDAFREWKRKLKRYGANCVINGLEKIVASSRDKAPALLRLEYFKTHKERMKYLYFRKQGWPIGSGAIEGACKSLIKQRTNLSGQRWSPDGALNILWIRAMITDELHDLYWKQTRKRARTQRELLQAG